MHDQQPQTKPPKIVRQNTLSRSCGGDRDASPDPSEKQGLPNGSAGKDARESLPVPSVLRLSPHQLPRSIAAPIV